MRENRLSGVGATAVSSPLAPSILSSLDRNSLNSIGDSSSSSSQRAAASTVGLFQQQQRLSLQQQQQQQQFPDIASFGVQNVDNGTFSIASSSGPNVALLSPDSTTSTESCGANSTLSS